MRIGKINTSGTCTTKLFTTVNKAITPIALPVLAGRTVRLPDPPQAQTLNSDVNVEHASLLQWLKVG
jgi:hypothetical protein